MKKYRLDLAKQEGGSVPCLVPDDNAPAAVYVASEVEALLRAILKELDDDDLNVAKLMVRNALSASPVHQEK